MNGKEALYKKRSQGQASREVRVKLKAQQSKTKRDDLLASKRRIPLGVIQEHEKPSPKPKKLSKMEQSALRLEKLKEWKKAREEGKLKASKQTKKPFNFGGLASSSASGQAGDQKNIFLSRPQSSAIRPKDNVKPTSSSLGKPKPINKTSAEKPALKPSIKRTAKPSRSTAAPSKPSKPIAVNSGPKSGPKTSTKQTSKPALASKEPKKQPAKVREDTVKPMKSRPQTRSMTKSAVSKVKAESRTSCSTKIQTRGRTKQAPKSKPPERSVTTRSSTKVITKDTDEMMDITVEISNPAPSDKDEVDLPPPVTPPKANRYDPVTPSPLLRSRSAKRRETQYSIPQPITDPAWIPGQPNGEEFVQPNFDEAFGSFSPFQFGGSNNSFQFTFRKELFFANDSLENVSNQQVVTPNAKTVRRSLGSDLKHSPVRNVSMDEGALIVEVPNEGPSEEEMETGTEAPLPEPAKPEIDIGYFRKLHSDVTATLTSLCEVWDGKATSLEDHQEGGDMEEVLGQVRTTVCQARLLMRKKLKQYLGLVDTAETQSGERKTTAEDLQGFWDMVYFQVEDIYQKFHGLETIEKNGWTLKAPTPKKKKTTKKRVVKKATAKSAEESERAQAAREKREAQRNKLKELKMAAKRAREEAVPCEQENAPTTPKKSKIDELSPKTGSAYKNGRRQSLRLRNRCVFSPCFAEDRPAVELPDVCVAPLISFD